MNVVLGFVVILLISYASSRLALFRGKLSLGAQSFFGAGAEFLLLGFILGPAVTQVLTGKVLVQLSPVLSLGLGWIGLLVGLQFDRRVVVRIPAAVWKLGAAVSVITFLLAYTALELSLPFLFRWTGIWTLADEFPRSGIDFLAAHISFLLAWTATVSTSSALALILRDVDARGGSTRLLQLLTEVRHPMAIGVMGLWYCFNHVSILGYSEAEKFLLPYVSSFHAPGPEFVLTEPVLSGAQWMLLTWLLGVALGWMLHYLTSERLEESELLLLTSGSVIFSGGLSSYLHLSPLFVNLVMGVTLANLPNFSRGRTFQLLLAAEKPFYVVFMILTGALWPPLSPMVLGLFLIYAVSRAAGLWLGSWAGIHAFLPPASRPSPHLGIALLPQGGIALALAMDFVLIHPGVMAGIALNVVILSVLIHQVFGPALLTAFLRASGGLETKPHLATPSPDGLNHQSSLEAPGQ
ncbi:MAG: hypothetical protein ACE15F_24115 [bacterium]